MKNKIWFTYKARIQAHNRLEWLDFHSQCILVWYAVLSATLAVITIRHVKVLGDDTDILATILSVALLGLSLAVANRDFRGRALMMRKNYLGLQSLYSELESDNGTTEQRARYEELLTESENHRVVDDRIARTFASGLTSRFPTIFEALHAVYWLSTRAAITLFLYAAPVLAALYAWKMR